MKKLSIIILAIVLTQSVFAQKGAARGGGHYYGGGSRAVIVSRPYYGFGLGYGAFYNPYFYGAYPGYYPYGNGYGYGGRMTKLDRQIMGIKDDYSDRIYSVRQDNSLTGRERRQKIRELKHERDEAVQNEKANYYKQY